MNAEPSHRHIGTLSTAGRVTREGIDVPKENIGKLKDALEKALQGEVRFGIGDRALYATDASNYRQLPYGVILPKSAEDVVTAIRLCNQYDMPITPRGGGTSLARQTTNTTIIIDFSKYMHRIISLDPEQRLAVVEPGCILDHLRNEAEKHGLTFGPDPSTHDHNTLGGMVGNDSCGVHSIMAGRTADNVRSLEVVTYDGLRMTVGPTSPEEYAAIQRAGGRRAEIYRQMREFWEKHGHHFLDVYPRIPRRVSGYENLDQLAPEKGMNIARALTGTEATCVIVLSATLELVPSPPERVLAIIGFESIFAAADAVPAVLKSEAIGIESIDHLLTEYMKKKHFKVSDLEVLPEGRAWLVVEFGAQSKDEAEKQAGALAAAMVAKGHSGRVVSDKDKQQEVWEVREASLAVTAHVPGQGHTWPGWEDSAVLPENLGDYLRELVALFHQHGYEASVYGHFGDGLVHCRVNFDLSNEEGIANWRRFLDQAADLVVKYGGSLSGEHGDGQARAELLEKMYGPDLMQAQRAFRAIWDPRQRMNPGKLLDPYPITSNLRVGPSWRPQELRGLFAYPEDHGSFTEATLRCVGVGKCRRREPKSGVMCPSYLGTNEEKHSTRGRARLLFEMMRGDALKDGFASDAVEEALDLCLACKGCKHDCPVNVDMASYKAEFRARHYAHKWRPRAAYSMGQIERWAWVACHAPWLANVATHAPGLSALTKWVAGISQQRTMPRFASPSFRVRHAKHPRAVGERVLLWPDTFNNYFRPETAIAATQVLERFGFQVDVPPQRLCCGRPLYDWGWISQAKDLWRKTLNVLRDDILAGVPLVGLEPACISAFRDELPGLFPNDPVALKLEKQTFLLTEFLDAKGLTLNLHGEMPHRILVQFHCHHRSVLKQEAAKKIISQLSPSMQVIEQGCCGMAGSFGFEADKFELSRTIAERGILGPIQQAGSDVQIVADGFSCREQIEQLTGRATIHPAELLSQAL